MDESKPLWRYFANQYVSARQNFIDAAEATDAHRAADTGQASDEGSQEQHRQRPLAAGGNQLDTEKSQCDAR